MGGDSSAASCQSGGRTEVTKNVSHELQHACMTASSRSVHTIHIHTQQRVFTIADTCQSDAQRTIN